MRLYPLMVSILASWVLNNWGINALTVPPTSRPTKLISNLFPRTMNAFKRILPRPLINDGNIHQKPLKGHGDRSSTNASITIRDSDQKFVVAHHMVGNTYPYTIQDWKNDIQLASSHSIDAFALNIGKEDWMASRVADAYEAARTLEVPFKLFLSLDMTSLSASTSDSIRVLQDYVSKYSQHPNQFLVENKPVVSTFAGEGCNYGGSLNSAWTTFKDGLSFQIHFIPSLFVDPLRFPEMSFLDGAFNWNGAWPTELTSASTPSEIHKSTAHLGSDVAFTNALQGKSFMTSVSPWFFTHYGADTWNKNWIYRGDDWLFSRRWEQVIQQRDTIDIVQILSWNDYGESHYIGPITGAQPNSQAWVDGFDHLGWLEMSSYYAQAFKTGTYPPLQEDKIFLWARPHPREANAPDRVPRPNNAELTDDFFWVVVFARDPCTAVLYTPSVNSEESSIDYRTALVVDIPRGVSKLRHSLMAGNGMAVLLERNGETILKYIPEGYLFNPTPATYNFNAWVGWKSS